LDYWRGLAATAAIVLSVGGVAEEMARIEGVNYIKGKPGPGELTLNYQRAPELERKGVQVKADGEGRFVFESVHPGEVMVGRFVEVVQTKGKATFPKWTISHTCTVFTRSGETAHVEIGKPGSTLTGQLVPPEDAKIEIGWQAGGDRRLSSTSDTRAPEGLSEAEQQDGWKEYQVSDVAKTERGKWHVYVVNVEADGRFHVADVEPGNYDLFITVDDANKRSGGLGVGHVSRVVNIPEGKDVDLGAVTIELYEQRVEKATGTQRKAE
jgi:hypothetical protein